MSVLRGVGLGRRYGSGQTAVEALADVDIEVRAGRLTVVRGPSGSGKTTLLNLLGGLDRPTSGRVLLGDDVLSELSEAELAAARRDRIGYVFQNFGLIPVLSAAENVEVPLRLRRMERGQRDERVAEVALMRALGASRRQLGLVQFLELSLTGLLAGLMGAAGATLLGWLLAREVFDFAYQPSLWLLSGSILASMLFIVLAGGWNIWRLLDTPPLRALRGA